MTDREPLVRLSEVSRTFGSGRIAVVAVHGATAIVPQQARIAVMGASGSGKSTLLHLMAGIDAPTSGRISWPALGSTNRLDITQVGVVFQGPSLMPPLSVVENVAVPLVLQGVSDAQAQRRAHEALSTLGINDLAVKLPEELSGGQAQRVAVARVLAAGRPLIIADEPTGQLDHTAAHRVMTVLLAVADQLSAGLVVSTHDPSIASYLDSQWAMQEGILATDSAALQSAQP